VSVRNAAVIALCFASVVLVADVAAAQSCGAPSSSSSSGSSDSGSDDSSSSNSGGSSSGWSGGGYSSDDDTDYDSGSSSSSSSESRERVQCQDSTDITGMENCTRFGAGWNTSGWPALRLELGPSFRRLSLEGMTLGGETYHDGNPHRFVLEADDLDDASVTMGGFNFRITGAIGRHFLLGAEFDMSAGGDLEGEVREGDRRLTAGEVMSIGGGLVFGVSLPVGPLRFRGEVYAGGQTVGVTTTSYLGDCISESRQVVGRWVVEPRVGIELFVGRFVSFDVWGGADVINAGSFSGGLRLNLHTRSYDAVR